MSVLIVGHLSACQCEEVNQLINTRLKAPAAQFISHCYDNELIQYADSFLRGLMQLIALVDLSNYLFADLIWRFKKCHDMCEPCVCITLCNPDQLQK